MKKSSNLIGMDFILFLYLNNKNFSGLPFGCEQEGAIKKIAAINVITR